MILLQKRMGVESIWDIAFDYLLRWLDLGLFNFRACGSFEMYL